MTCLQCSRWYPACRETGYDADGLCILCQNLGYEITPDGEVIAPDWDARERARMDATERALEHFGLKMRDASRRAS